MNTHLLWYTKPAGALRPIQLSDLTNSELVYDQTPSVWESQALPVGNGYMGAMVYGTVPIERIQFNEKTLWTGGPGSQEGYTFGNVPGSGDYLPVVRAALARGDKEEALALASAHLVGSQQGFGAYQSFGEIQLAFEGHEDISNYTRGLDLDGAMAYVQYDVDGVTYRREVICSYPDHILAVRLTASRPKALSVAISFLPAHQGATVIAAGPKLTLHGTLPDNGMIYEAQMTVLHDGQENSTGGKVSISADSEITLLMSCGTDYRNLYPNYRGDDPHAAVSETMQHAIAKPWAEILKTHQADHRVLYQRMSLSTSLDDGPDCPTDELLAAYQTAPCHGLETLMFHYGRYLLIASSRPGSLPANLQGAWNDMANPPWQSDYHFNINLQMNYWPAEVAALTECSDPLVDYVHSLMEPGNVTAATYFGSANGWAVNTMNNPFGFTAPGWHFTWGWAPNSNAFIAMNLWEKYLFSQQEEDLRRIYPILRGAAIFWLEYLSADSDGTLVSSPSYSPEHGHCEIGCAMDQQLAYFLLDATITASQLLGEDEMLRREMKSARENLSAPIRVGRWGQLQEWKDDLDDPADTHRHISQLIALYPGSQIGPDTPQWMDAARTTLLARGDASTGWSRAMKLCLWARLLDGDHAYALLQGQLQTCTFPNLFDLHPPFQIDGNFGYVAGVCEILVQSHRGEIVLLPALPSAWKSGRVQGIKARGGFTLDIHWRYGKLETAVIHSDCGQDCTLRIGDAVFSPMEITKQDGRIIGKLTASSQPLTFCTKKGETYVLQQKHPSNGGGVD